MLIKFYYYFLIGYVSISLPPKQISVGGLAKMIKIERTNLFSN